MTPRPDGRAPDQLRPLSLQRRYLKHPEGSCLVAMGDTHVICAATVEDRVPMWMKDSGRGWVTAEYAMLPRATNSRTQRDPPRPNGRSIEISRLIGRSLRSVVDLSALGERTITVDCDVIQADGGTRTAAINGAWVALMDAFGWMVEKGMLRRPPVEAAVAAVSVGVVSHRDLLDLDYAEDSRAAVDLNVVMTSRSEYVEVQGTAEGMPFGRDRVNALLDLADVGIRRILELQSAALS
jgi:ribonuclease PH